MKDRLFWKAAAIIVLALAGLWILENRWVYMVYSEPDYTYSPSERENENLKKLDSAYDSHYLNGAMLKIDRITGREYVLSKSAGWVKLNIRKFKGAEIPKF